MQSTVADRFRFVRRIAAGVIASLALATVVVPAVQPSVVRAAGVDPNDWLAVVNAYRSQSGLAPVASNGAWASGTRNHSCWMLLNGIAHDEPAGTPGYTADGDQAGNAGNVAVSTSASTTAQNHISLWMSGPFHAIGILRASLTQTSYGQCTSPPNPSTTMWKSAATLDVVRGANWSAPKPSKPVVFPGNGATTSLTRFIAESPDPRSFCGWSGANVGLPLIALMPAGVTSASATLSGPNGPVNTCVLTKSNTSGVASSILGGDNAVVVVPASPLATGTHRVTVNSTGGNTTWSFNVDPNAPLVPTETPPSFTAALGTASRFESVTPFRFADSRIPKVITRLPAGKQVRISMAGKQGLPGDITAVSANFTVIGPDGPGFFTAFNCSPNKPGVSTLNYRTWEVIANQAVVPLDRGSLCVYSSSAAHLVIDVNGFVTPDGASQFVPVNPKRLLDTRMNRPLAAGATMRVVVAGGYSPVPLDADGVALNLTMVGAVADGWIRAYPCDAAEPGVSNVNTRRARVRANSVIVPTAADGSICIRSNVKTHVLVDVTGWFGSSTGHKFVPLTPIRLSDTRSYQASLNPAANAQPLAAGKVLKVPVAGVRGVPSGARAATVNLVALDAPGGGWLRAVPCGTTSDVSNLNYLDTAPVANGANVKLSSDGAVCVVSSQRAHVIVDVTGIWT